MKFNEVLVNVATFEEKVWTPLKNFGWVNSPEWLKDTNYINKNNLYNALKNEYYGIELMHNQERFYGYLINALAQLLPEAYFKTIKLQNENLLKINFESILATTQESEFENGKNTLETYSASSSSPDRENAIEDFTGETASEKDITKIVDNRKTVQNFKDISKAIRDIENISFSGVILNVIQHNLISRLFDYNFEETTSERVLSTYYTQVEVDDLVNNVSVDLSPYYTKSEVNNVVNIWFNNVRTDLANYYTKTQSDANYASKSTTYTKTESDTKYSPLINGIVRNNTQDLVFQFGSGPQLFIKSTGLFGIQNNTFYSATDSRHLITRGFGDGRYVLKSTFDDEILKLSRRISEIEA